MKRKQGKNSKACLAKPEKAKRKVSEILLKRGSLNHELIVSIKSKKTKKEAQKSFEFEQKNLSLPGLRPVSSSLLLALTELPGSHRLYASNQVSFPIRFISSVS